MGWTEYMELAGKILRFHVSTVVHYYRRTLAFDLPSAGELQFIGPVIASTASRLADSRILVVHHGGTREYFNLQYPELADRVFHVSDMMLRSGLLGKVDVFITSEQYCYGVEGIYSICIFHGQPSKGLTFTSQIIESFDAFFLYGDLHRMALNNYLRRMHIEYPQHLSLYDIGYPKTDDVINGSIDHGAVLEILGLDKKLPTIVYAPAFNEHASLRENGLKIIKMIASHSHWNVIAKLPIDCSQPTTNYHATGGIDWYEELGKLLDSFPNFKIYKEFNINPLIVCADVAITCVSSVSFEFLVAGKPVVFIDTPRFYIEYLQKLFPGHDTKGWADDPTINAGRDWGHVVDDLDCLPQVIEQILCNYSGNMPSVDHLRAALLYNPGKAAEVAADQLALLLEGPPVSRRDNPASADRLAAKAKGFVFRSFQNLVNRCLLPFGVSIKKIGNGYIHAGTTIEAANKRGISLCEYLESREPDIRKRGRRDTIIESMNELGLFKNCKRVCEIGAGTGMYLEKILEIAAPLEYEVYETEPAWRRYLLDTYGFRANQNLKIHVADGRSLKHTADESCDLVHAHGVFVYLPFLQTLEYLRHMARICRNGKYVVFDYFPAGAFTETVTEDWLNSEHRFPVLLPEDLLVSFAAKHSLQIHSKFQAIYGASFVEYAVFQKCK